MGRLSRSDSVMRVSRVCLLVVVSGLALNATRLAAIRLYPMFVPPVSPSHEIVPFTVGLRVVTYLPGEPPIQRSRETYAVRSDGSHVTRREGAAPDGSVFIRRDLYLRSGSRIEIDDVAEEKTTYAIADFWRYLRDPASKCVNARNGAPMSPRGEEIVGEVSKGQYPVVLIRGRMATSQYAPSMGCALLYGISGTADGPHMVRELDTIVSGDPDESLFAIPDRFHEVPGESGEK